MAIPLLGHLVRNHPWPMFVGSSFVAAVASLIRELVHQPGTIGAVEGVALGVTLAAGACAVWALVAVTLSRRNRTG